VLCVHGDLVSGDLVSNCVGMGFKDRDQDPQRDPNDAKWCGKKASTQLLDELKDVHIFRQSASKTQRLITVWDLLPKFNIQVQALLPP